MPCRKNKKDRTGTPVMQLPPAEGLAFLSCGTGDLLGIIILPVRAINRNMRSKECDSHGNYRLRRKKRRTARSVLEALPDWFEVPESREAFIRECVCQLFYAAFDKSLPVGFIRLKKKQVKIRLNWRYWVS